MSEDKHWRLFHMGEEEDEDQHRDVRTVLTET